MRVRRQRRRYARVRRNAGDSHRDAGCHAGSRRNRECGRDRAHVGVRFDPSDAVAKAGKVTVTAPNVGNVVHELVLLKTDADPAKLPTKADGSVDESTSVGEIADVEAGATKKVTLDLQPGTYAMVCALPGHYQSGMYGSLTVK